MAAVLDLNDPAGVHLGPTVIVVHRHSGEGEQHVQLAYARSCLLHLAHLTCRGLPQVAEQLVLQGGDPGLGGENVMLQVFQFLGDEPLTVAQGLLADIVLGHQGVVGLGHLDVVAEYLVVAHLQVLDAGALPLPPLDGDDPVRPVVNEVPQLIHFPVVARTDKAPLPDGKGQLVVGVLIHNGPVDEGLQLLQTAQAVRHLGQHPPGQPLHFAQQLGQYSQSLGQQLHVPGVGAAIHHLADEPLQVGYLAQAESQLLPGHGVPHQRIHCVLPPGDISGGTQGPLNPGADHPVPHGRPGPVQNPQ